MRTGQKRRKSTGVTEKTAGTVVPDGKPARESRMEAIAESIHNGRYFIDGISVAEAIIRRGGFRGNS